MVRVATMHRRPKKGRKESEWKDSFSIVWINSKKERKESFSGPPMGPTEFFFSTSSYSKNKNNHLTFSSPSFLIQSFLPLSFLSLSSPTGYVWILQSERRGTERLKFSFDCLGILIEREREKK